MYEFIAKQAKEGQEIVMHPLVQLAQQAIALYVSRGEVLAPPDPEERCPEMNQHAGIFVSLKKHGELRGCVGTWQSTQPDVAHEVITNAIAAATRDPRFFPVEPKELADLEISVDMLSPLEEVFSLEELDPQKYGVIVEQGWRRGLLLPDLPQITSPEMQVEIAKRKAGLSPDESARIFRFTVNRYH